MSDLLASTILLQLTPAIPVRAAPVAAPVTADFMAMLGELVLGSGGKPQGGKGQALAADGNILPVTGEGGAEDETDPAIVWLPAGMLSLPRIEAEPVRRRALVETTPAPTEMSAATPPAGEIGFSVVLPQAGETADVSPAVAQPALPMEDGEVASPRTRAADSEIELEGKTEVPVRERPSRPVRPPVATPIIPGIAIQNEAKVFATAISASFETFVAPSPRADAVVPSRTAAAEPLHVPMQMLSDAEQPAFDLSRDDRVGKAAIFGERVPSPSVKAEGGKGQELVRDDKLLPVEVHIGADPAIARLPAGRVPLQPIEPAPLTDGASRATPPPAIEGVAVLPEAGPAPAGIGGVSTPVAKPAAIVVDSEAGPAAMPAAASETVPDMKVEGPPREQPQRPAPAPVVTPQPVVPGTPVAQPAAKVFAAAISASFDSATALTPYADAVIVQNQTAATEQLRTTVQALSDAEQPPLDLSRDDWAGKMIDRIAALRDAAEAADTRIRLAPENLGTVDVSIRRDGDRLHVHFAAESAATRQLLAEAAPRLAELADARGVKLGQTSVDAGAGGQQGSRGQPETSQPARPASTAMGTSEADHDDRVA